MVESADYTPEEVKANFELLIHCRHVSQGIHKVVKLLLDRADVHDNSKMYSPEVELFAEYSPKLSAVTYGSKEYKDLLDALKPALIHHYSNNSHHPEFHKDVKSTEIDILEKDIKELESDTDLSEVVKNRLLSRLRSDLEVMKSSVNNMTLLDIIEMNIDWKAATKKHRDGNIRKSIEHNGVRFGIAPQLSRIFENTVSIFD